MGNPALKSKKSQSLIEATMMLVAGILFLLGAFRIGVWYNAEIAERQPAYQNTRVEAGSDNIGVWPIHARRDLTDEWVLQGGDFPPKGTFASDGGSTGRVRDTACEEAAKSKEKQARDNYEQAAQDRFDADDLDKEGDAAIVTADYWLGEYNTCFSNCKSSCWDYYCDDDYCASSCSYYSDEESYYRDLAQAKYDEADDLRQEADDLEAEADDLFVEADNDRKDCWKTE